RGGGKYGVRAEPAVIGDGAGFLAAWIEWRDDRVVDVLAARIDGDGRVIDDPPMTIATAVESGGLTLSRGGGQILVTWTRVDPTPPFDESRGYGRILVAEPGSDDTAEPGSDDPAEVKP